VGSRKDYRGPVGYSCSIRMPIAERPVSLFGIRGGRAFFISPAIALQACTPVPPRENVKRSALKARVGAGRHFQCVGCVPYE